MEKNNSIARDFKIIASIIMVTIILISSIVSIIIYNDQKEKEKNLYQDQAAHIDYLLTETL